MYSSASNHVYQIPQKLRQSTLHRYAFASDVSCAMQLKESVNEF